MATADMFLCLWVEAEVRQTAHVEKDKVEMGKISASALPQQSFINAQQEVRAQSDSDAPDELVESPRESAINAIIDRFNPLLAGRQFSAYARRHYVVKNDEWFLMLSFDTDRDGQWQAVCTLRSVSGKTSGARLARIRVCLWGESSASNARSKKVLNITNELNRFGQTAFRDIPKGTYQVEFKRPHTLIEDWILDADVLDRSTDPASRGLINSEAVQAPDHDTRDTPSVAVTPRAAAKLAAMLTKQ